MTLSNFDWTDKYSQKWFIMLSHGHEGPYSLETLLQRQLSPTTKIWSEGLSSAVELSFAGNLANDFDGPPPLPPIPEEEIPPLPFETMTEQSELISDEALAFPSNVSAKFTFNKKSLFIVVGLMIFIALFFQGMKGQEKFEIHRPIGMSPEIHQKILDGFQFEGWDKKIFFKEYTPADLSHIWLVTDSFQNCQVEAVFTSLKDKLLTMKNESVSFKTKGVLKDHLVDFTTFDFTSGNKVLPGLYEMNVKASQCVWDGLFPKIGNGFSSPDENYMARTKVILFAKGADEFNQILDKLVRKKLEVEIKNQNQEDLFWQDLQQKFQTLLAVSLQIEQLFLDFLDKDSKNFKFNRQQMESLYTRKFGGFLTKFVVANEEYFKGLGKTDISDLYRKQSYESLVRLSAKKIGHEAMTLIEDFQTQKIAPSKSKIEEYKNRVKKIFNVLKEEQNLKIIQVTEERSK